MDFDLNVNCKNCYSIDLTTCHVHFPPSPQPLPPLGMWNWPRRWTPGDLSREGEFARLGSLWEQVCAGFDARRPLSSSQCILGSRSTSQAFLRFPRSPLRYNALRYAKLYLVGSYKQTVIIYNHPYIITLVIFEIGEVQMVYIGKWTTYYSNISIMLHFVYLFE